MIKTAVNPNRLNHLIVDDIYTSQHWAVIEALDSLHDCFVKTAKPLPTTVIEIGTLSGGFTTLLSKHKLTAIAKIHTFDIVEKLDKAYRKLDNIVHHFVNVFETPLIQELLRNEGTALLFCDGGNKIKEFNLFAQYLKSGDYIFCHDYIRNKELFENTYKDKIWNWWESNYAAIQPAIVSCGLECVLTDVFEAAVWGSFYKP